MNFLKNLKRKINIARDNDELKIKVEKEKLKQIVDFEGPRFMEN